MPTSTLSTAGFPVMVGAAPLFCVTSFKLTEGYEKAAVAGTSNLFQLVRPSTKKIDIEALLPGKWRALRPLLEFMGITSRALAAGSAPLMKFTGLPVVARTAVSLDMQITSLVFTQTQEMPDTLSVAITLEHVPRSRITELLSGLGDLAVGVVTPFV